MIVEAAIYIMGHHSIWTEKEEIEFVEALEPVDFPCATSFNLAKKHHQHLSDECWEHLTKISREFREETK